MVNFDRQVKDRLVLLAAITLLDMLNGVVAHVSRCLSLDLSSSGLVRWQIFVHRYHFIRDALQDGVVDLRYCKSEEQVADILTKALPKDRFNYLRGLLGVKPVNNLEGNVEM
ncbi:hypothetical protein L3X38_017492 [Prunus dulcis]|uniref:Uncharacterized protein n=1 Tax=Prunus dulcis TaxID=3755 RepID=A0AAD4W9U2_PRUDU|nr:hypothetical protein L3X38_017492 [Prunus dulcis]